MVFATGSKPRISNQSAPFLIRRSVSSHGPTGAPVTVTRWTLPLKPRSTVDGAGDVATSKDRRMKRAACHGGCRMPHGGDPCRAAFVAVHPEPASLIIEQIATHCACQRIAVKGDLIPRAQIGLLGRLGHARDGDTFCLRPGQLPQRPHGGVGAVLKTDDPVEADAAILIRGSEPTCKRCWRSGPHLWDWRRRASCRRR